MEQGFNFDQWMQLAKEDPVVFEQKRQSALQAIIDHAPEDQQRRLKGLQFQIDAQCSLAKSDMERMVRISKMMHQSFHDLRVSLNDVVVNGFEQTLTADQIDDSDDSTAKVIPFKHRA